MLSGAESFNPITSFNPNNQAGILVGFEQANSSQVSPVSSDGTYQAASSSWGRLLAGPDSAGSLAPFYRRLLGSSRHSRRRESDALWETSDPRAFSRNLHLQLDELKRDLVKEVAAISRASIVGSPLRFHRFEVPLVPREAILEAQRKIAVAKERITDIVDTADGFLDELGRDRVNEIRRQIFAAINEADPQSDIEFTGDGSPTQSAELTAALRNIGTRLGLKVEVDVGELWRRFNLRGTVNDRLYHRVRFGIEDNVKAFFIATLWLFGFTVKKTVRNIYDAYETFLSADRKMVHRRAAGDAVLYGGITQFYRGASAVSPGLSADVRAGKIRSSKELSERIQNDMFEGDDAEQLAYIKEAAQVLAWSRDRISFNLETYVEDLEELNNWRRQVVWGDHDPLYPEAHGDVTAAIAKALSDVERKLFGKGAANKFGLKGKEISYMLFALDPIELWEGADEAHDPVLLSIRLVSKVFSLHSDARGHYEWEPVQRIDDAIKFASLGHGPQVRKGTSYPYIIHPLGAATIIAENGGDIDQIIAGLMHDLPEDTNVTVADIRAKFGDRVANALEAVVTPGKSAGKSKLSWEESKQLTIDHIGKLPLDGLIVEMADKLDNMRAIRADFEALGDGLWSRFKRGKDQQGWYYRSLAAAFAKRTDTKGTINIAREFAQHVEAVFGGGTSSGSPVDPTPAPQTPSSGSPPAQASSGSSGGSAALMAGMVQPGAMGLSTMPVGASMFAMPIMPAMSIAPVLV